MKSKVIQEIEKSGTSLEYHDTPVSMTYQNTTEYEMPACHYHNQNEIHRTLIKKGIPYKRYIILIQPEYIRKFSMDRCYWQRKVRVLAIKLRVKWQRK